MAPWTLTPGESKTLTFALVYGRSEHHLLSVAALKDAADAVRAWHSGEPLPPPFELEALAAPIVTSPEDQALFVDEPAVFSWTEVPGAAGYSVDLSLSPSFADPFFSASVDSAALAYPISSFWSGEFDCNRGAAACDREVFWRVRAYGAPAAISPPSETRSFAVIVRGDNAFAASGLGITEVASASGLDPCRIPDAACPIGLGNAVLGHPDAAEDYLVGNHRLGSLGFSPDRLTSSTAVAYPDNYEIRFTEACARDVTPCYGLYYTGLISGLDESLVVRVPFEAWNVGGPLPESTTEPARLLPVVRPSGEDTDGNDLYFVDWADSFPATRAVEGGGPLGPVPGQPDSLAVTDEVYLFMPTQPDGYDRFTADAVASGGAGAVLTDTYPGDPECPNSAAYADFCFRSEVAGGSRNFVVGRLLFADYAGDGTTPGVGTVVRFWGDNAAAPALPNEEMPGEEAVFALGAPYPNPVSGRLTVPYALESEGYARVSVFDVLGREVAVVREGPARIGTSEARVDVSALASGLYLVVLEAAGQRAVRRITVAR